MRGLIYLIIDVFCFVLLLSAIVSWVAPQSRHPAILFLHRVTEPVLAPVRRVLPPLGGVDLSPLAVFLLLRILQRLL